ncbi:unnamed protein product [Cuscuta europaea]|uniref:Uncharacterized protein n=1 Tax=Cuscuta europaea TaxID=41803 RepID=A0A9P0YJU3_CUSEU|nr:unnamed protein product [Cuscuta europaea]
MLPGVVATVIGLDGIPPVLLGYWDREHPCGEGTFCSDLDDGVTTSLNQLPLQVTDLVQEYVEAGIPGRVGRRGSGQLFDLHLDEPPFELGDDLVPGVLAEFWRGLHGPC